MIELRCTPPAPRGLLVLFGLILLVSSAHATPASGPFRMITADSRGVTLEYEAPEPALARDVSPLGTFDVLSLADHNPLAVLGRPALPVRSVGLGIPEHADVEISVEPLETRSLPGLRPVPASDGPVDPEAPGVTRKDNAAIDAEFYDAGGLWPVRSVEFREMGHLRHHRVGQVVVTPMQWDPRTGDISFLKRARIRIDFRPRAAKPGGTLAPVGREEAWESLYESSLINYESARQFRVRPVLLDGSLRHGAAASPPARTAGVNPEFRIHVSRSGLYRLSFADLTAQGWPAGIPVDRIRLFEKSRNPDDPSSPLTTEVPVRVQEYGGTAGVFDQDDGIVFHARNYRDRFQPSIEDNRFTNFHVYWLTWDEGGGARMNTQAGWAEGSGYVVPQSFAATTHYEQNNVYIYPSPNPNFVQYFEQPNWETMYWLPSVPRDSLEFSAVHRDASRPFRLRARWQGFFLRSHQISIWQTRGTAVDDTLLVFRHQFGQPEVYTFDSGDLPGTRLADGRNLFKFSGNRLDDLGRDSEGSGAYFDWFEVDYHRRYVAVGDFLEFNTGGVTGNVEMAVRGLTQPDLVLVDVTDPAAPRWVDLAGAVVTQLSGPPFREYELRFRAQTTGERKYILYTDAALPSHRAAYTPENMRLPGRLPRELGTTNLIRDSSRNVSEDTGADVIVLTHPGFEANLAPWVALREAQGHRLKVVSPQEVYNQYSGGDKSPPAIREWLRTIYRTWAKPPDYLVLAGDASEDYKRDLGSSDPDWVPTMMLLGPVVGDGNRYELIGQDHYFIASLGVNDSPLDLLPDMHIGRMPIGSAAEADILVSKLVNYDNYSPGDAWRNRGLITSDDKYNLPISGNTYTYSRNDCDFEAGADSVLSMFAKRGCFSDFEVEDLRLGDCLNDSLVAQSLGRRVIPRGECPILPFHNANLGATVSYVDVNCAPIWVDRTSRGHLFQMYSGHGNRFVMATESWVDYFNGRGTADRLTNFGKPFIYFGVACHLNEFESAEEFVSKHALAEAMLFLPNAGAIASMASTGFEWLVTNFWVEVYMMNGVFVDNPVDPDTGRPRRVLGDGIHHALLRMATERGGGIFLNTFRSYCLLGDPTMRIDMAPPRFDVTVNGAPVTSGAEIAAPAGSSRARIEARIADDVDYREEGFVLTDGDSVVAPEDYTVTPFEGSGEGACRGLTLVYEPELRPQTYLIDLKLSDWLGRQRSFQLSVRFDIQFRIDGRPLGDLEFVPRSAGIEVDFRSPVELDAADIDVIVNGEDGYFSLEPQSGNRVWTGRLVRELPAGRVDISARIRGVEARAISVSAGDDLNFSDIYFYPNPWDGISPARFTYQLRYREGDRPDRVSVTIFTVSGRRVVTLDAPTDGGRTWLDWDGRDARGDELANGVYLYKLTIDLADGKKLSRTDRIVVHK